PQDVCGQSLGGTFCGSAPTQFGKRNQATHEAEALVFRKMGRCIYVGWRDLRQRRRLGASEIHNLHQTQLEIASEQGTLRCRGRPKQMIELPAGEGADRAVRCDCVDGLSWEGYVQH